MHDRLLERIRRFGPLPYASYVETALLDPEGGFFAAGGGAGREGADFLTSPEVGPLFGAVIARALDRWWDELGQPDPYVVVEAGAGAGTLARTVLDAEPACGPALHYVLVEPSPVLRARQAERLPLEPAAQALGPVLTDAEGAAPAPRTGPVVVSLAELPAGSFTGAVLANELLDNLPFGLLAWTGGTWAEVRVGADGGHLVEVLVAAPDETAAWASSLAPDVSENARIPVQRAAASWVREACGLLRRGKVVVIDYADTTAALAARPWWEWLRTYRGQARGSDPLDRPGSQDITCEVARDQLPAPDAYRTQAAFLADHGLAALVAEARAAWDAAAGRPDLAALKARSRVAEAQALTDPDGLGAFAVLEWERS